MTRKELKALSAPYKKLLLESPNLKDFRAKMKDKGFSFKTSSGHAYINYDTGLVIKLSYLVKPKYRSRHQIPTYIDFDICEKWSGIRELYDWGSFFFLAQPVADTDSTGEAYRELKKIKVKNTDLEGNTGKYKGRAVMIDW